MGIKDITRNKDIIRKLQAKTFSRTTKKQGESSKDFLIRTNKTFVQKKERFEKAIAKDEARKFNRANRFF